MLKQHQSQPCPNCNRTFSSETNLNNHIKKEICKKKQKKTCDRCGYTFTDIRSYKYHIEHDVCKYSVEDSAPIKQPNLQFVYLN